MTPYCSTEILVLLLSFQKPKQFLRWRRIWAELFPTFGISLKFGGRGGTGHSARAQDGLGGRRRQHSVCCHPPAPVALWAFIFAFPMVAGPSFFGFVDLMGDVGIGSIIDTFGSLLIIYLTMTAILYNTDRIKTFSAPTGHYSCGVKFIDCEKECKPFSVNTLLSLKRATPLRPKNRLTRSTQHHGESLLFVQAHCGFVCPTR